MANKGSPKSQNEKKENKPMTKFEIYSLIIQVLFLIVAILQLLKD